MAESVFLDCLSTHSGDSSLQPIQTHHLISTKLQEDTWRMTQIEYHWGMEKGQLDLQTPLNILHLSSDMKDSLGNNGWTISPSIEMLEEIMSMQEYNNRACKGRTRRRRNFTEAFPVGIYEYDFVPLNIQEPIFVRRLDTDGHPTYTRYESPYTDLPRIKSHAHPFFVIHLSHEQITRAINIDVPEDRLILTMDLYQMWSFGTPSDFSAPTMHRSTRQPAPCEVTSSVDSSDASQSRGVKRPYDDDIDEDEDEDDADDESSRISPISESIRTPKDSTSTRSESCKRPRLDLSVLGSALLYDPTSLLRWTRGAH